MEVGAPTSGMEVALSADALTPRDGDLNPVLGPEVQRATGMPILSVRGCGSRWPARLWCFVPVG